MFHVKDMNNNFTIFGYAAILLVFNFGVIESMRRNYQTVYIREESFEPIQEMRGNITINKVFLKSRLFDPKNNFFSDSFFA